MHLPAQIWIWSCCPITLFYIIFYFLWVKTHPLINMYKILCFLFHVNTYSFILRNWKLGFSWANKLQNVTVTYLSCLRSDPSSSSLVFNDLRRSCSCLQNPLQLSPSLAMLVSWVGLPQKQTLRKKISASDLLRMWSQEALRRKWNGEVRQRRKLITGASLYL